MTKGTGAEAGNWIVQLVDGATNTDVFRVTINGAGAATVTGLGPVANLGTDTVTNAERLLFQVHNDPFVEAQSLSVKIAPAAWVYEPNHDVGIDGGLFDDVINVGAYHTDKDATWDRIVNASDGADTVNGSGFKDRLNGDAGNDILNGAAGHDELMGGTGDDTIDGGVGADAAIWELPSGLAGNLQYQFATGLIQRVDGATVEDVFRIENLGAGGLRVTGLNSQADMGVDTLTNVEALRFYFLGRTSGGVTINYATSPWTDEPNHRAGVNGIGTNDTINLADYHGEKDVNTWTFFVYGATGDDRIFGMGGVDNLDGGPGADNLFGDAGADILVGGDGDDYLQGGVGTDSLDGGAGRDTGSFGLPTGTAGTFRAVDGTGSDAGNWIIELVDGGTVTQVFRVVPGANPGSATVTGLGPAANLGTDTVVNVEELQFLVFNDPFDPAQSLNLKIAPVAWVYEPNHDVGIDGTERADVITVANYHQDKDVSWDRFVNAGGGDDTVNGSGLNERIQGQAGDDILNGAGGHDELIGGMGDDTIDGGTGGDAASWELPADLVGKLQIVAGSSDSEKLVQRVSGSTTENLFRINISGNGAATVTGLNSQADKGVDTVSNIEELRFYVLNRPGDGASWFFGPTPWADTVNNIGGVNSGPGDDTIFLSDFHGGKDTNVWTFTVNGAGGKDTIHGMNSVDRLNGGAGDDFLFGNGGADTLNGGDGADYMLGGPGADTLDGGAGLDVAAFGLPTGTAGTFRAVRGTGADVGNWIIELVDGSNVTQVFRVVPGANAGSATVTGLGLGANLGTDTITNVEELHFQVFNDPFNPAQFLSLKIAATPWVNEADHDIGVDGGAGADVINMTDYHQDKDGTWDRIVHAGDGNDTVHGGGFAERIYGEGGDDTLYGNGGHDVLVGGAGNDTLYGGAGADAAVYELPADLVGKLQYAVGSAPNIYLINRVDGATVETLFEVTFTETNTIVRAIGSAASTYGTDTLYAIEDVRFNVAGRPMDGTTLTVSATPWVDEANKIAGVTGGPNDDFISIYDFHPNKDFNVWSTIVFGGGGRDVVIGMNGKDVFSGGAGDDSLNGSGGDDTLNGDAGDDNLWGAAGDDKLNGGEGVDRAAFNAPQDMPGIFRLVEGSGSEVGNWIVEFGDGGAFAPLYRITPTGEGRATVTGLGVAASGGTDTLTGIETVTMYVNQAGVETNLRLGLAVTTQVYEAGKSAGVIGSMVGDTIDLSQFHQDKDSSWYRYVNAGYGADTVNGTNLNESISGEAGADTLNGGGGDDYLIGGDGADTIDGGAGNDTAGFQLAQGTAGTLRAVAGAGADAGAFFIELVDGATVEQVFKVVKSGATTTVTGLNRAASSGTDTLTAVEGLSFYIPVSSGTLPSAFLAIAPRVWSDATNKVAWAEGSAFDDVLDFATLLGSFDPTWSRSINGGLGSDTITGGAGNDTVGFQLAQDTAGTLRAVAGAGADAGAFFIELVDGATVEQVFKVVKSGATTTVTGLNRAASSGTDTLTNVEGLSFYTPVSSGTAPSTFLNVVPRTWNDAVNKFAGVDGSVFDDVIDVATLLGSVDPTWTRSVNASAGNDTVTGSTSNDNLFGNDGDDTLSSSDGADRLTGGAGNDTLNGGAGNDIAIFNLPTGTLGSYRAVAGTGSDSAVTFVERVDGSTVERVFKITTTNGVTTVQGLGTAASLGTDTLTGVETLQFYPDPYNQARFLSLALSVQASGNFVNGTLFSDTIDVQTLLPNAGANVSVIVYGNQGDDVLKGHDGPDLMYGGLGNDTLIGRGGDDFFRDEEGIDSFEGDDGFDRISFVVSQATQGVIADLATGVISNDGFGNTETMTGIEGLGGGTIFADRFYGDGGGNMLIGGTGDTIEARGGDDSIQVGGAPVLIDGGAGVDSVRFLNSRIDVVTNGNFVEEATINGVIVDLANGKIVNDGFGNSGDIVGVEIVTGAVNNDTLIGDDNANELYGLGGADTLMGGGGDDVLVGSAGADMLVGGAGIDTAVFSGNKAGYAITAVSGGYKVTDTNAADGDDGADQLLQVEVLKFSDGDVNLVSGVSISPAVSSLAEGHTGTTYFDFVVTRTSGATAVVLPYVIAPTDTGGVGTNDITGLTGGSLSGTVSFAAGQTSATIRVPVIGDATVEEAEAFTVTLGQPSTGSVDFVRQQATGRILNDDNVVNIPAAWARGINFGDPHLVTLDGLQYEMQAVGEFVLIESTAGPEIDVHVRTVAVNAYASEIVQVGAKVGTATLTIDGAANTILVDGVALMFGAGETSKAVGDGSISRYSQNGSEGWVVMYSGAAKSALIVLDLGDRLDVSFATDASRAGQFKGLLGNFDSNASNDLALRDGTILTQPVPFADFYDDFVSSWRVSNVESLLHYGAGEDTSDYTDLGFPPAQVKVTDFPSDLVVAATAAATAAGITDPALKEAAIRDYLLTGDAGFLSSGASASGTTAPTASADVGASAAVAQSVGVGAAVTSQDEGHGGTITYTFKIYRTAGSGTLDVDWAVTGQTFDGAATAAVAGDFSGGLTGTVSFLAGETEKDVTIHVKGDADYETNEGFKFTITPQTNVPVIAGSVLATIVNDDAPPVPQVGFSTPLISHSEGNSGATAYSYTVLRSGSTTGATSVNWGVTGDVDAADFLSGVLPGGTLTFAAGETSKAIEIKVVGDTAFEASESFSVSLDGVTGGTIGLGTAIGAIINDDAAPPTTLGFAASTSVEKLEGASGSTVYQFTVTRGGDSSGAASVTWAVGGGTANAADFGGTLPSGALNFAAGETTQVISVTVTGDTVAENDESFTVTLSSPTGGSLTYATAQGVIRDDDTPPPAAGGGTDPNPPTQPKPPTVDEIKTAFNDLTGVSGGKLTAPTITLPDGKVIPNPVYVENQALIKLLAGYAAGTVTQAQVLKAIVDYSEDTSMVALQAYQFFTGKTPTKLGMSYLIDSAENPNDLTDPYFAMFNVGNRFINFAVNLGHDGEGKAAFAQNYGSLSFETAVAKAYEAIIGRGNATADGVDVDKAIAYLVSQKGYFTALGHDDIGAKAAMVGFIMYIGVEFETGKYYDATVDYLGDMFTGTPTYNVDLIGSPSSSSLLMADLH
jgi:Ca2+-binding RTX toxin-like protein